MAHGYEFPGWLFPGFWVCHSIQCNLGKKCYILEIHFGEKEGFCDEKNKGHLLKGVWLPAPWLQTMNVLQISSELGYMRD